MSLHSYVGTRCQRRRCRRRRESCSLQLHFTLKLAKSEFSFNKVKLQLPVLHFVGNEDTRAFVCSNFSREKKIVDINTYVCIWCGQFKICGRGIAVCGCIYFISFTITIEWPPTLPTLRQIKFLITFITIFNHDDLLKWNISTILPPPLFRCAPTIFLCFSITYHNNMQLSGLYASDTNSNKSNEKLYISNKCAPNEWANTHTLTDRHKCQ